jgi:hypothetical protein
LKGAVYSNYKKRKRKAAESHTDILEVFEGLEKDWYEALSSEGHWFSLMGTVLPFEITTYAI